MKISVTSFGSRTTMTVRSWDLIKDVKDRLQARLGVDSTRQRLFFRGVELKNTHRLVDCGVTDYSMLLLVPESFEEGGSIRVQSDNLMSDAFSGIVTEARKGLSLGLAPRLAMDGIGGTYFLRSVNKDVVAVFKPGDEEPFTPNNPKGYVGQSGQLGVRAGVLSGEGHLREVAAYLLDHKSFAGVPPTTLAEVQHDALRSNRISDSTTAFPENPVKVGALQQFVINDGVIGDMAPQSFTVSEVHKIAILDIRIFNLDRNDANLLVQRAKRHEKHEDPRLVTPANESLYYAKGRWHKSDPSLRLVPIDHSYSLPDTLEVGWADWVWLEWPQVHVPMSKETLAYIKALDDRVDTRMLRDRLGLREQCLRTLRITTLLLKRGAAAGLTLYEIGSIAARQDMDLPSRLEQLVESAMASAADLQKQRRVHAPLPVMCPVLEAPSPVAEDFERLNESVMKRSRSVTMLSKKSGSPGGSQTRLDGKGSDSPPSGPIALRRDQSEMSLSSLSPDEHSQKASSRHLTESFLRALGQMLDQTFESVIRARKPEPPVPPPPAALTDSVGRDRSYSSSSSPSVGDAMEEKALPKSLRDFFPTPAFSPAKPPSFGSPEGMSVLSMPAAASSAQSVRTGQFAAAPSASTATETVLSTVSAASAPEKVAAWRPKWKLVATKD